MQDWWRGAVIYQIYPRSFYDSNGDGIGDLPGIVEKLEYVASLGVDAIWLSPVFPSPMRDFGYDIADYRGIDPIFGSNNDFDLLIERAHALGLRLIIDQVYSHTSDRHPWFLESRADASNPRADWYVWADARPDGTPPNNWLSYFGGPAWSWDTRRRQYYLHNFLAEQPDLNFHHPDVRQAVIDVARYWLDRGVDGFRLDVANYYFHDQRLRDNPVSDASRPRRPYSFQRHHYNRSQPETLQFLKTLRELVNQYPGCMTVAEIASSSHIRRSIEYTEGNERLHTAYSFIFLECESLTPEMVRRALEAWDSKDAWPSWSFSNHDVKRAVSRWGGHDPDPGFAKIIFALLCALRGTVFIYQGEELGLPQADIPFEKLRDPEAIRFWPENLGRDGSRSPMPWKSRRINAGFSRGEPWLPVDPRHAAMAVDQQELPSDSMLNFARAFLGLRKEHTALIQGEIVFHDCVDQVILFERVDSHQRLLCAFNLSSSPVDFALPVEIDPDDLLDTGLEARIDRRQARLPGYGGLLANLDRKSS